MFPLGENDVTITYAYQDYWSATQTIGDFDWYQRLTSCKRGHRLKLLRLFFFQGHAGLGFAIGEGRRAQDGENGIFIRNVTEGGTAYKVKKTSVLKIME